MQRISNGPAPSTVEYPSGPSGARGSPLPPKTSTRPSGQPAWNEKPGLSHSEDTASSPSRGKPKPGSGSSLLIHSDMPWRMSGVSGRAPTASSCSACSPPVSSISPCPPCPPSALRAGPLGPRLTARLDTRLAGVRLLLLVRLGVRDREPLGVVREPLGELRGVEP